MSELEKIVDFLEVELAKLRTENTVLRQVVAVEVARQAKQYQDPTNYIMTLTAPILSGFDDTEAEDDLGRIAFEHGISFCNQLETAALDLLQDD